MIMQGKHFGKYKTQNDKAPERSIKEHATLLWAMEEALAKVYSVRGRIP